jgi:hypothetical protein
LKATVLKGCVKTPGSRHCKRTRLQPCRQVPQKTGKVLKASERPIRSHKKCQGTTLVVPTRPQKICWALAPEGSVASKQPHDATPTQICFDPNAVSAVCEVLPALGVRD